VTEDRTTEAAAVVAAALDTYESGADAARTVAETTYRVVTPDAGRGQTRAGARISHRAWAEEVKKARRSLGSRRGFGDQDSRIWYRAGEMLAKGEESDPGAAYSAARLEVRPHDTDRVKRPAAVAREMDNDLEFTKAVVERVGLEALAAAAQAIEDRTEFEQEAEIVTGGGRVPSLDEVNQTSEAEPLDGLVERIEGLTKVEKSLRRAAKIVAGLRPLADDEKADIRRWALAVFDALDDVREGVNR
jgi:hypothetical protein